MPTDLEHSDAIPDSAKSTTQSAADKVSRVEDKVTPGAATSTVDKAGDATSATTGKAVKVAWYIVMLSIPLRDRTDIEHSDATSNSAKSATHSAEDKVAHVEGKSHGFLGHLESAVKHPGHAADHLMDDIEGIFHHKKH